MCPPSAHLGDIMLNFDGFNNILYQCLDQKETECEEQDVEDTLTIAEEVPKKNAFWLMMSTKRAFVDDKKRPTWIEKTNYSMI